MWITAVLACICEHSWHNRWSISIKRQRSPQIRLLLSGVTPFSRALHHFPGSVMLPNQCRPSARTSHLTATDTQERSTEGSTLDILNRRAPSSIRIRWTYYLTPAPPAPGQQPSPRQGHSFRGSERAATSETSMDGSTRSAVDSASANTPDEATTLTCRTPAFAG